MPNNFRTGPDPVITAIVGQVGLIAIGFAALLGIKLAFAGLRVAGWLFGIHL